MADHLEATVTLPSDPASVSAARRYVAGVLTDWGLPTDAEAADTVRLIVSELATNAVQHTFGQSPTFTVDVQLEREEELRIGVTDSHPRWPKRLPAAVQQDNGRGMVIIRWLAAECGGRLSVAPTADGGKTVWIALPWTAPVQSG
ncbi:ATP-binding protein [Streptomyces violascens]|uniref:ATP-binding protein n=1 Tax=Streptomyces violascens TaxID=67381 RepID=UPI00379CAD1C